MCLLHAKEAAAAGWHRSLRATTLRVSSAADQGLACLSLPEHFSRTGHRLGADMR
jgi:hypothetical protein